MSLRGTLGAGLLLLGLVLPAPARAALEWKFKEGDKFYVEAVTDTKQTKVIMGEEKKITSASTFTTVSSFVVKKADAGSYTLEQTVEGVKVKLDKDDTAAGVAERFANQLKGAKFTFTINAAGKITSDKIGGYDDLIKKLGGGSEAGEKAVRTLLPEETLREELNVIFVPFPEKEVSKGATWNRDEKLALPWGTLKGEAVYTYQGKGKDGEEISVSRKWTYELPKEGASGVKVTKGDVKVDQASGTIVVDPAAGRLIRHEQSVHVKGRLTATDSEKKETTFDVDQTTTRILKRVEKNTLTE
jgi:hypothetical protein